MLLLPCFYTLHKRRVQSRGTRTWTTWRRTRRRRWRRWRRRWRESKCLSLVFWTLFFLLFLTRVPTMSASSPLPVHLLNILFFKVFSMSSCLAKKYRFNITVTSSHPLLCSVRDAESVCSKIYKNIYRSSTLTLTLKFFSFSSRLFFRKSFLFDQSYYLTAGNCLRVCFLILTYRVVGEWTHSSWKNALTILKGLVCRSLSKWSSRHLDEWLKNESS